MAKRVLHRDRIVIPNTSTVEEQLVKSKLDPHIAVHTANDLIESVRSYSPGINQRLVSIHPELDSHDIFGCGLEKTLIDGDNLFKRRNSKVRTANGPVCKPWNSKEARETMLNNLRASGKFDCSKVVTPQQIDSNCWFNTFFVTFFISDKGRKFFRFFRELMIRGEHVDGRKLPPAMAHAFFFLNVCIEAAHNNKNVALAMNTNHIILKIYDSIRLKDIDRLNKEGIGDVDEAGNPLEYYTALMGYVGGSAIRHRLVDARSQIDWLFDSRIDDSTPHLYVVELSPHFGRHIPTKFRAGGRAYALDATVVMDTTRKHFCSTLTCGKQEMGFDGASFSRLEPFQWKALLNEDRDWTFEGSIFDQDDANKIWWNFRKSYSLLFYYRT